MHSRTPFAVTRGLDPRVHLEWIAGSSPAMTRYVIQNERKPL
jgi:hypothetical protein